MVNEFDKKDPLSNHYNKYGPNVYYYGVTLPPFNLNYEYALSSRIGMGICFGYFKTEVVETRYNDLYSEEQIAGYDYENFSVGTRFNYHFGKLKVIDPYVGIAFGYSGFRMSSINPIPHAFATPKSKPTPLGIPIDIGVSAGLRFFIWKGLGVYVEVGYIHWALAQAGLVFRLN